MFWLIQGLGLAVCILTELSFVQKEKWKMMFLLSATNILLITTYILCGSLLSGLLVVGALIRTIVYSIYSKSNKRPEPFVMILFEIYYVVISIVMWNNNFTDLFIIVNVIIISYTTWQNDMRVLRLGYIMSSMLLIPFDIMIGAYVTTLSEIIMLANVVTNLIKHFKVVKNAYNVPQRYFDANKHFWGSSVITKPDYDMILSTQVDRSPFYNFGIVKNQDKLYDTILSIKQECKDNNVNEIAYISFDAKKIDTNSSNAHLLEMFCPIKFNDVWMKLIEGFNLNNTKCKIKDVIYKEIDESKLDDLITVYLKGYHAKADITDLTDDEKTQIENLKNLNLKETQDGIKVSAYVAYYNDIPVSLLCVLTHYIEAFITKVSTIPVFRRKHIASSLMQFAISKQRVNGIQDIILVTDKYSSNEKFYQFNSFVEFGQAFALDVSDISKYKGFIEYNLL